MNYLTLPLVLWFSILSNIVIAIVLISHHSTLRKISSRMRNNVNSIIRTVKSISEDDNNLFNKYIDVLSKHAVARDDRVIALAHKLEDIKKLVTKKN